MSRKSPSADRAVVAVLGAVLRGEPSPWPVSWNEPSHVNSIVHAATVHGIAGLLVERTEEVGGWPPELIRRLRDEALAQAMWEMRHRQILTDLLDAFQAKGVRSLVLKGTAVAYDRYDKPSTRSRGDTDLLVAPEDVSKAKDLLAQSGFASEILGGVSEEFALQQTWTLALPDGGTHSVDLHWQVMNAQSLNTIFAFEDCLSDSRPLPRMSPAARTLSLERLLIHSCLHRAMQHNAPYFVGGEVHFEPDRLIWMYDIHLIAAALDRKQWSSLSSMAGALGVARPIHDGLQAAQATLRTPIPEGVTGKLKELSRGERTSSYFMRSHPLARAWQDILSVRGLARRLRYVMARVVTTEDFLRSKYPHMAHRPLPLLYGRRLMDVVRRGT